MCTSLNHLLAILFTLLASAAAWGAPIVNNRTSPVTVLRGPETPVQTTFNGLFQSGAPSVALGQSNIGSFRPTASTVFTFLSGISAYRGSNAFGIYATTTGRQTEVFAGGAPNGLEIVGSFSPSAQAVDFGWFLDVPAAGYQRFSNDLLNPDGLPQMLVFTGAGQAFIDSALGFDGSFDSTDLIIAFEDLNRSIPGQSDDDFNDLIVLIENVQWGVPHPDFEIHMPEPGSMAVWSLLASVGGICAWRRRGASRK